MIPMFSRDNSKDVHSFSRWSVYLPSVIYTTKINVHLSSTRTPLFGNGLRHRFYNGFMAVAKWKGVCLIKNTYFCLSSIEDFAKLQDADVIYVDVGEKDRGSNRLTVVLTPMMIMMKLVMMMPVCAASSMTSHRG